VCVCVCVVPRDWPSVKAHWSFIQATRAICPIDTVIWSISLSPSICFLLNIFLPSSHSALYQYGAALLCLICHSSSKQHAEHLADFAEDYLLSQRNQPAQWQHHPSLYLLLPSCSRDPNTWPGISYYSL